MQLHGRRYLTYHGCTVVQAVVMFTTGLIGKVNFWTAGNRKPQNQLSPNFAQVITSVCLIYMQILVAIGCRGTSRHMREL